VDGAIIAGSFLVDARLGLATTIAVALHEIPQEIGDLGVLVHAGLAPRRAVVFNLAVAMTALIGVC
jgi:zinc and cadmium transporter